MHAPRLLFTQRVWGTEPWGKLERSAEMAEAVGAEVVVVHPPFRWQKTYAAGFVEGIAALEASTGIAFAVENMYPWRASSRRGMEMYLPGWDPSEEPTPTPRSTSPRGDRTVRPDPDGPAPRRPAAAHPPHRQDRLGQGRAPGPGARLDGRGAVPCATSPRSGSAARSSSRSTPRKCRDSAERETDLRESLEFAREHSAVGTP